MSFRDQVRAAVPFSARHRIAKGRLRARLPTGRLRALPRGLIIGAQRSGTSSLYRYLSDHPGVASPLRKEIEYFSRNHGRGENWYRAHFTFAPSNRFSFEATPDYLLHPLVPARVAQDLPDIRCVVLLRDPVARAYSHYLHMMRLGYETMDFDDAIAAEPERIEPDLKRLVDDPLHDPRQFLLFSYVSRGRYAEQLARWFEQLPRERFLVIRSEDLYADTPTWFERVTRFFGLEDWQPPAFQNVSLAASRSKGSSSGSTAAPGLSETSREALQETFRQPNRDLADLLGLPQPWW